MRGLLALAGIGATVAALAIPVGQHVQAQIQPGVAINIGIILPELAPDASPLDEAVARGAEQGAVMAEEEFVFNGGMLDIEVTVPRAHASGAEAVVAAAERLVTENGAFAIAGGFQLDEAVALSRWAEERGVPFINVGVADDTLRNELCGATTFHVEPSAAMYLDALAGWYVRAGFRNWFVIQENSEAGDALHERLAWTLANRHFGAREAGQSELDAGGTISDETLAAIRSSRADLVVLLVGAEEQLSILTALDGASLALEVVGFPYPETQTRTFFAASLAAAPAAGAQHRIVSWEATLDAYGAREVNSRYRLRWNEPMDPAAWATWSAVKVLYETAFFTGSVDPAVVLPYLVAPRSVYDVSKGIGTSFRIWDRQLRQSLFLDKILETSTEAFDAALLVGELPAIYMPGTDPVERMDQLGDLADRSRCSP